MRAPWRDPVHAGQVSGVAARAASPLKVCSRAEGVRQHALGPECALIASHALRKRRGASVAADLLPLGMRGIPAPRGPINVLPDRI